MSEFGHNHDRRDAWKKMSEWSHSVPDYELDALWDDHEGAWDEPNRETGAQKFAKFVFAILGLIVGVGIVSFVFYQLTQALGIADLTFRDAVVVTVCVAFIRYTDAGIIKQIK
jgi:hypothetical protein